MLTFADVPAVLRYLTTPPLNTVVLLWINLLCYCNYQHLPYPIIRSRVASDAVRRPTAGDGDDGLKEDYCKFYYRCSTTPTCAGGPRRLP